MMDSYPVPDDWREIDGTRENKKVFVHDAYDIHVYIVHDADAYPSEGESHYHEGESDQILRWRGWVTVGKSIKCGIHTHAICNESCIENEQEVMQWAIEWMQGDFDGLNEDVLADWEK